MGRKPNAVVLEFFERGRKLEDASNRYEHTCKRCRAQFPKGRIDALIGHVLRRCLNVTQQERDLVALHLKQNSNRPHMARALTRDSIHGNSEALNSATTVSGHTFAAKQQQSALDTLAEVSRQQLDFSSHLEFSSHERMHTMDDRQGDLLEHTLIMQLERANRDREVESSTDLPLDHGNVQTQHDPNEATMRTALSISPLIQTASAANRRLEQTQHLQADTYTAPLSALDPQLDLDSGTSDTMSRQSATLLSEHQPLVTSGKYDTSSFADLHRQVYETGWGHQLTHTKTAKGKPRTRFSDARRKEVREIRKRGACIRCRMLKKSCTDGTPCATCARVESARLWKGGCVRTRIAEQFTLWSAGLFYCLASIAVPAAIQGQEKFALSGCIDVCFDPGLMGGMTFACEGFRLQDGHAAAAGPDVGHLEDIDNILILLEEGDSMVAKIESYVSSIRESWIDQEPNPFIRATLLQAQRLSSDEKTEKRSPLNTMSGRSCYNLQQDLLESVLELWLETRLLSSRRLRDSMQVRFNAVTPTTTSATKGTSWIEHPLDESITYISTTSRSYALIRHQLFATIEARCAKLSKNIMNELERRVLQRKQVSAFSTFISAVLLLNCVERMTGLFRSYDTLQTTEQQCKPAEQHDVAAYGPTEWPFDCKPDRFWHQGHDFAELLNMLLRLRSLPPNTCCLEDGSLTVKENAALPVSINGESVKDQNDEATRLAADWLNPLQLNVRDLWSKVNNPVPRPDEDIEAWDLRFVAELLLPV